MIDLHCHLLHGLDEGPATMEESVRMLQEAKKVGIKTIITTLHVHKGIYKYKNEDILRKFHDLRERAAHMGVDLKLGYEVFIAPSVLESIDLLITNTLNHTEYMLIEIPYRECPYKILESIYRLKFFKIKPVIAHPERYGAFVRDGELTKYLIDSGCLLQVDTASIIGVYGRKVKYISMRLIKSGRAHFVASNAHFAGDYSEWYIKAYWNVVKWTGTEHADRLFRENASVIIS